MRLLNRRIFPGFTLREGLLWLCFHAGWELLGVGLYFFSGLHERPGFLPLIEFTQPLVYMLFVEAFVVLPFWWLFFKQLSSWPLHKKILLHLLTAHLYTFLTVGIIYVLKTGVFQSPYRYSAIISDLNIVYVCYFIHFALFHAYNFWLDTKRRLIREQELKDLAHQSEIKALKSQIEPHFLFNTLNSISASVPPSLEKTRVLIAQLADTFRYGLHISERDTVSLQEELDFIQTWLALEQHRFGSRLTTQFFIDDRILHIPVPPMILQPIVENALNHGLSSKIEGGCVTIECKQADRFAHIIISDTGVGYAHHLEQMFEDGIGLNNIARRLQLLYHESLHVERNGQGLKFSFKIPLQCAYEKKSIHH